MKTFNEYLEENKHNLLLDYMTKNTFTFNTLIHQALKNEQNYTIRYPDFLEYVKTQYERLQIPEIHPPEYYFKKIEEN